jgi:hypothetical protein
MKTRAVTKKGTQSRKGAILESDFMEPTKHIPLCQVTSGDSANILAKT